MSEPNLMLDTLLGAWSRDQQRLALEAPDMGAKLAQAGQRAAALGAAGRKRRRLLLGGLAGAAILLAGLTLLLWPQSQTKAKLDGWELVFEYPVPAYWGSVPGDINAKDGMFNRINRRIEHWRSAHNLPARPAPFTQLYLDKFGSRNPCQPLVSACEVRVFVGSDDGAVLDSLEHYLSQAEGLEPAMKPLRRAPVVDFNDKTPFKDEACTFIFDGERVSFPAGFSVKGAARAYMYLSSLRQGPNPSRELCIFSEMPGMEFPRPVGPLAVVSLGADGSVIFETVAISPKLKDRIAKAGVSTSRPLMDRDKPQDYEKIARNMLDGAMQQRPPTSLGQGRVLVYPLLPEARWQAALRGEGQGLSAAETAEAEALYGKYRQAAQAWLSEHPDFADQDYENNHCHIAGRAEGANAAGQLTVFEVFIAAAVPEAAASLRAALDAVPGVHPRVERPAMLWRAADGQIGLDR